MNLKADSLHQALSGSKWPNLLCQNQKTITVYRDPQLEGVNFQTVFHKQKTSWKVCR